MKQILLPLTCLLLAAAPAPAAEPPPPEPRARFHGLFVDWSAVNRDSIEAERQGALRPAGEPVPAAGPVPGSAALGERVGEIVATGDCGEGERIARAAGDFALVAAVRQHCAAADPRR